MLSLKRNIKQQQEKQKTQHDAHSRVCNFKQGDSVLVWNYVRGAVSSQWLPGVIKELCSTIRTRYNWTIINAKLTTYMPNKLIVTFHHQTLTQLIFFLFLQHLRHPPLVVLFHLLFVNPRGTIVLSIVFKLKGEEMWYP